MMIIMMIIPIPLPRKVLRTSPWTNLLSEDLLQTGSASACEFELPKSKVVFSSFHIVLCLFNFFISLYWTYFYYLLRFFWFESKWSNMFLLINTLYILLSSSSSSYCHYYFLLLLSIIFLFSILLLLSIIFLSSSFLVLFSYSTFFFFLVLSLAIVTSCLSPNARIPEAPLASLYNI